MQRINTKLMAVGRKQTLSQIKKGNVVAVFIALDADEEICQEIKSVCQNEGVEYRDAPSMVLLGKACAISRPAACAAILKTTIKKEVK